MHSYHTNTGRRSAEMMLASSRLTDFASHPGLQIITLLRQFLSVCSRIALNPPNRNINVSVLSPLTATWPIRSSMHLSPKRRQLRASNFLLIFLPTLYRCGWIDSANPRSRFIESLSGNTQTVDNQRALGCLSTASSHSCNVDCMYAQANTPRPVLRV